LFAGHPGKGGKTFKGQKKTPVFRKKGRGDHPRKYLLSKAQAWSQGKTGKRRKASGESGGGAPCNREKDVKCNGLQTLPKRGKKWREMGLKRKKKKRPRNDFEQGEARDGQGGKKKKGQPSWAREGGLGPKRFRRREKAKKG